MSLQSDDIGDTLALVNAARMAFGKDVLTELPDSKPGDASDCLYFRALTDVGVTGVGSDTMNFDSERKASYIASIWGTSCEGTTVRQPKQFQRVISRFDSHELPHYEGREKPRF